MDGRTDLPSHGVLIAIFVVHVSFIKCENCVPRKINVAIHSMTLYVHIKFILYTVHKNAHSIYIIGVMSVHQEVN